MSPDGYRSDGASDSSESSSGTWEFVDNYTAERPPHLNLTNVPSVTTAAAATPRTLPGSLNTCIGSRTGSELDVASSIRDYAHSSLSGATGKTDSTIKGDEGGLIRSHLLYYINRNYDGGADSLTKRAKDALDNTYTPYTHGKDIDEWIQEGCFQACPPKDASVLGASTVVHGSRSHTSRTTGSWSIVSSVHSQPRADRTSEWVAAAGWQFDDAPAYPRGRILPDEDL
ncbi:hypothetical protein F5Y15DRAFT_243852 [Xylariaceae sp. FL0016]|nr:hypothetical protein F5Y15DRAFT_243852 [Xylariaceae sp. FL0016]